MTVDKKTFAIFVRDCSIETGADSMRSRKGGKIFVFHRQLDV